MRAVQDLPAKQHSQSNQFVPKLGWIGYAIQQANPNWLPEYFFLFNIFLFIYFFRYETIETQARAFLSLISLAIGTVLAFTVMN